MSEAKPKERNFFLFSAYAQNFNRFKIAGLFKISAISSKKYIFEEEKN